MSGTCSVIIPIHNEKENVVSIAKAIRNLYPDFQIIFMDDGSTDNSKDLIEKIGDPQIRIITRKPEERGLAASCFEGIIKCNTDYFMTIDCDFQHPPSALKEEYIKLEEGYDLVVGTRNSRLTLGLKRWAGSWIFNIMANLYLFRIRKRTTEDVMSGLYSGRCDMFVPIIKEHWGELEMQGWKVLMDLLKFSPTSIKISTIRYDFGKRAAGKSHINSRVITTTLHQMGKLGQFLAKVCDALLHK